MAYERKDGDIAVFKNEKANDGNNLPPYTGTALIDGKDYSVAFWVKQGKGGNSFFSGKIGIREEQQKQGGVPPKDDLPF